MKVRLVRRKRTDPGGVFFVSSPFLLIGVPLGVTTCTRGRGRGEGNGEWGDVQKMNFSSGV